MVEKVGVVLFALVALVAVSILVTQIRSSTTGDYVYAGGGYYYYGTVIAQMQPDEACTYSGYAPVSPMQVRTNEFGTMVSVCSAGGTYVEVPLVQTIVVPHTGNYGYHV